MRCHAARFKTTSEAIRFAAPGQGGRGCKPLRAPKADEVHRQLPRILASSDFVASERHRRFLRHVVERTLRGETATGHEIGTLVFGRPSSFNATTDPIVLIEAGKLPCDLETYYLKSGQHDALRISMPRGAYRAISTRNDAQVAGVLCALRAGSPPRRILFFAAAQRRFPGRTFCIVAGKRAAGAEDSANRGPVPWRRPDSL